jgi:hypothetical protein
VHVKGSHHFNEKLKGNYLHFKNNEYYGGPMLYVLFNELREDPTFDPRNLPDFLAGDRDAWAAQQLVKQPHGAVANERAFTDLKGQLLSLIRPAEEGWCITRIELFRAFQNRYPATWRSIGGPLEFSKSSGKVRAHVGDRTPQILQSSSHAPPSTGTGANKGNYTVRASDHRELRP